MPEEPFRFFRPSKLSRRHFARKSFRLLCRTSNREAINRDWKTFLRRGWEPHPCRAFVEHSPSRSSRETESPLNQSGLFYRQTENSPGAKCRIFLRKSFISPNSPQTLLRVSHVVPLVPPQKIRVGSCPFVVLRELNPISAFGFRTSHLFQARLSELQSIFHLSFFGSNRRTSHLFPRHNPNTKKHIPRHKKTRSRHEPDTIENTLKILRKHTPRHEKHEKYFFRQKPMDRTAACRAEAGEGGSVPRPQRSH
jgi:hypothetical protein